MSQTQESYVAPNLIASGSTFTDLQAGGLTRVIQKLIAANAAQSNPTVAATVSVTGGGRTLSNPTVAATVSANGGGRTLANPTAQATVSVGAAATGSLPAGTYYVGYTWNTPNGETTMGAGTPPAAVSNVFTQGAGNIPTVTLPNLPAGATFTNVYLSDVNGASSALVLYRKGITQATGGTCSLDSATYNGGTFAAGTPAPTANTTAGALAAAATGYYAAYSWNTPNGETTIGTSVSTVTIVTTGQVPRVTIPALPTGATSANIYLSDANGTSTALKLYATGVTGLTYDLTSATFFGGVTFANATAKPAANTTAGGLAAGTYYVAYTVQDGAGETTIGTTESAQFTVSAGNVPRVTLPALPTGASCFNIYLTAVGGASGTETLYATGVIGPTFDLPYAGPTLAGKAVPATNTTGAVSRQKYLDLGMVTNFNSLWQRTSQLVSNYVEGDPVDYQDFRSMLRHLDYTFAAFRQATKEILTLVTANPGTISATTTNTMPKIKRTFP